MAQILNNKIILTDMEDIFSRDMPWEDLQGKTILITGAYGMLASYMVFFLLYLREKKGIRTNIITQGKSRTKAELRFGCYLDKEYFSFTDFDLTGEGWKDLPPADYVVHAAGIANPRYYQTNPVEVIEPNTIGTIQLLRYGEKCKLRSFLYFSTGDIYGRVSNAEYITEDTVGCLDPLDIHSCYGESKRLGETACVAFFREYGVPAVIARIGHTYGPTMDVQNDPRVFASFMNCALQGRDIVLHSDGMARRPFCYIADAVAAFFLLLLRGKGGEAYNVTNTDQFLSISEAAQIIGELPEKKVNIIYKRRAADDSYCDNKENKDNLPVEKKLEDLGWYHPIDSCTGFKRVYQYFRNMEE